jgi:hypothetical protein
MNPPKPRKRIVPQLLSSPTGASKHKIDALSGPLKIEKLKDQAKRAKDVLGPGRKIYVDLAPYQSEHKQVSWKKLLEDQGAYQGLGKQKVGEEGRKPLDAYLNAITRAMTLVPDDSESDLEFDRTDAMQEDGEGSASGSDDEGQAQDDDGEGDKTGNDDTADATGLETNNDDEGSMQPLRQRRHNTYDYMDDFIDDSEFIQMVEYADKRKSKHRGFVIYRGKIERETGDGDSEYEYDEETGTRKKKRQRRTTQDADKKKKDDPTPKKKGTPYVISDEMKQFMDRIQHLASEHPEDGSTQGDDGAGPSKKRKMLPVNIREELIRGENLYTKEMKRGGQAALTAMLDTLHEHLKSFTSRENLRLYVTGKMGGKIKEDIIFSADKLKSTVCSLKPLGADGAEIVSDSSNVYLKYIPNDMQKKIYKQIKAHLKGESMSSPNASNVLEDIAKCFPEGSINLDALRQLVIETESADLKGAQEKEADDAKLSKEESNRGTELVDAMGNDLSKLNLETAVQKAIEHGALEAEIRDGFEKVKDDEFLFPMYMMLCVAGPRGLKLKYIGTQGQKFGLIRNAIALRSVVSAINKRIKTDQRIIKIKDAGAFYALKCMPGAAPDPEFEKAQMEAINAES